MSNDLYERHGAIAEVKLNQQDKLSDIDEEMLTALESAVDKAVQDGSVPALILCGEVRAPQS